MLKVVFLGNIKRQTTRIKAENRKNKPPVSHNQIDIIFFNYINTLSFYDVH